MMGGVIQIFQVVFMGQTSYLLGLRGPHPLDSYRLETQNRLRANQSLSLVGLTEPTLWSSIMLNGWLFLKVSTRFIHFH